MSQFWQTIRPVVIDLTKRWTKIRLANNVRKQFEILTIPVFSYSGISWLGASYVITEFHVTLPSVFSFILPVTPPTNPNFVLAVRYGNLTAMTRYKFWSGISEKLSYPVYAGERIEATFVIEVWSIQNSSVVSISDVYEMILSLLVDQTDCCSEDTNNTNAAETSNIFAVMNPYADLPLDLTEESFHA